MEETIARQEAQLRELAAVVESLQAEREQYRKLYLDILERYKRLERGLSASPPREAYRNTSPQLSLQLLGELFGDRPAEPEEAAPVERVREHERRKPTGRNPLPEHLPRIEIELLPPEVEREGTDAFKRIGEEVSEVLERRKASTVVARIVRPKFVRKVGDAGDEPTVLMAEPPERPIERGLAGPGFLAATAVARWGDHLPANRQEAIYAREGLSISRSTICSWHEQLAALARPLVDAMRQDALRQPYLCTDATGVLVQAKEKCRRGHFWVLVAPERHVLFDYTRKHDSAAVDGLLAGYQGYLVADAHAVYDHLYADGSIVEVACWAHARRYFFKALGSEPEQARHALALIRELFKIERTLKTAPRKKRESVRQAKSRPIVDAYFQWCEAAAERALDDTPLAKALGYSRNQRKALERFLDDGRLPLDNNVSERNLRREVLGRRNWLFVGSDDGALTNTVFVSLLASCQLHGLEPWAYLRDLFCLLPTWPRSRVLELAPANWRETLEQQDAQQRLAANVFRRLTIEDGHDGGV
ncbi:MAG: IS66 family transposase [Nannocystaceae bacterium]